MTKLTTKRKLMDTAGWGLILWAIGFALGMMLFPFVLVDIIGWPILAIMFPLTGYIAYRRFKGLGASFSYYLLVAVAWLAFSVILDYFIIVKAFNSQNYYTHFDLAIYYLSTFLIPLFIGYTYGTNGTKK